MFGGSTGGTGGNAPIFGTQPTGGTNIFTQQTGTGATGFPNTGGTTGGVNLFANQGGGTTPSLFSTTAPVGTESGRTFFNPFNPQGNQGPAPGTNMPLFNPPAMNPQGNPPAANTLFPSPGNNPPLLPSPGTAPSLFTPQQNTGANLFPGANQPQPNMAPNMGYLDQQNPYRQILEFILSHKKDSLKRIVQNSFMELSEDNIFKNQRLSRTQYENMKKTSLHIIKEVASVEKNVQSIVDKNKELFSMMDAYNNIARQKLSFFKKCFLQVSSKSNAISEIKDALDEFEKLAETEFDSFYQSIKNNRYTLPVITPSDFEMRLSQYTLRQAQSFLDKLNDYERCQQSTELATYIDVIPALIQYYKNVTCLVFEFREKYAKFKDEVRRNRGSSFIDIESKLEAQKDSLSGRASTIFSRILEIELKLNEKIQHCNEVKKKFKVL